MLVWLDRITENIFNGKCIFLKYYFPRGIQSQISFPLAGSSQEKLEKRKIICILFTLLAGLQVCCGLHLYLCLSTMSSTNDQ